jgi:hypothetical protein
MRKFFKWIINRVPELIEIALFIIVVIIMYWFYRWIMNVYIDSLIEIVSKLLN